MKRGYEEKIKSSFILLKNNPTLFLPDLAFTLTTLIIGVIFLYYNNLLSPILSRDITTLVTLIKDISTSTPKIISVLVSFLISLAITLSFGLSFIVAKYYLIMNYLNNKTIPIFKAYFESSFKYYFKLLGVNALLFLFFLIPLTILFVLAYIININYLYVIFAIILLIIWILLRLLFLFNVPILFLENRKVFETLKIAYKYSMKNKMHVFLTFLITLGISWAISVVFNIIPSGINQLSFVSTTFIFIVLIIFAIIQYLVNIGVNIWSAIFLFENYK